jgi:hypothetical protein
VSEKSYSARQRTVDRAAVAGEWIGSIPDLLKRIEALEKRVRKLERRPPQEESEER